MIIDAPKPIEESPPEEPPPPPPYLLNETIPRWAQPPPYGLKRRMRLFGGIAIVWFLGTVVVYLTIQILHKLHPMPGPPRMNELPLGAYMESCRSEWSPLIDGPTTKTHPYAANASFDIPVSTDTLFILSANPDTRGTVQLRYVTDPTQTDRVRVDIQMLYADHEMMQIVHACAFKRRTGEHGVGIIKNIQWPPRILRQNLEFKITVHVPLSAQLNSFETYLPNFDHHLEDFLFDQPQPTVHFKNLALESKNAGIHANVRADRVTLKTSHGAISGSYNISTYLHATTAHAPIQAHFTVNNASSDPNLGGLTLIALNNHHGAISASTTIESGDSIAIRAQNEGAGVSLSVTEAPFDSRVLISAISTNAPVGVVVPGTYKGRFDIETTHFVPVLHLPSHKDTSDVGPHAITDMFSRGSSHITGNIQCREDLHWTSDIRIQTTNAQVELSLL